MPAIFHTQIALDGYDFPEYQLTFKISGSPVAADVGKALSIDTAAANTVKLAADGDRIIGYLMSFEDRVIEGQKVGVVGLKFAQKLKIKSGETVIVGSRLVGAGAGEVKAGAIPAVTTLEPTAVQVAATAAAASALAGAPLVVAVADGYATALYL